MFLSFTPFTDKETRDTQAKTQNQIFGNDKIINVPFVFKLRLVPLGMLQRSQFYLRFKKQHYRLHPAIF